MTPRNEQFSDLLGDEAGAARARLINDLARVYRPEPPPVRLDTAVLRAIAAASRPDERRTTARWAPRLRPRLVAAGAALILVVSGLFGYQRFGSPAPVSAQAVLRRAAALQLGPNQAIHLVDTVSMTIDGHTSSGTDDVWLQTDANGVPALSAQSLSLVKSGTSTNEPSGVNSGLDSRFIQVGQQVLAYNPELRGDDQILLSPDMRGYPSWAVPNDVFNGGDVAQTLSTLSQASPGSVRLLSPQTLDGVAVNVVEVDGWTNRPAQRTIFYFDAQSSVLRGFDAGSLDPSYPTPLWQARLRSSQTMPATAVPAGAFALSAPASATIHPLDLGGPAFATVASTMAATCHGATNLKVILRSGQSVLAACQSTAPSVAEADLVTALAAPDKATLDAAAAVGVLTTTEAANYLAQVRAQLAAWVTTPQSAGTSSATPDTQGK
ncbi:MAG TPA: hypothetical protein VN837_11125 [Chloroflexota bacterium]|nr:hypothetical protein [Chloroflexota bacterium]